MERERVRVPLPGRQAAAQRQRLMEWLARQDRDVAVLTTEPERLFLAT